MNNISYFKLQAKNLFHDIKLDFMQDDENYVCAPRFFDVNVVVSAFNVDTDNFSLMKAQHLIAQMVDMNSWKELIAAPDALLEQKKVMLNISPFKIRQTKITHQIKLSPYEKVAEGSQGDYVVKCPRLPELEEVIKRIPDCYFLSCGTKMMLEKLSNDSEHIYVNVVPQFACIRVLVPGKKWPDDYAVSVDHIKVI